MACRVRALAPSLAALILAVTPALAQDVAAADALFNRGIVDMEAGRFEKACPAIEESQRLDPRPGTLFTLATCEDRAGRIGTATTRYQDYLSQFRGMSAEQRARQKGRDKIAQDRIAALTPKIPQLTLILPPGAPAGTSVTRDGVALRGPSLGVPLPVDPGSHVIVTDAPGRPQSRREITIAAGESKTVTVEPGEISPTPAPSATVAPPPAVTSKEPAGSSGRGPWIWIAGGIGVAGMAVGGIGGAMVFSKKGTIQDNCHAGACNREGLDAADSARTAGTISNVGFAVGALGIGTFLVLLATSPGTPSAHAAVRRKETAFAPVFELSSQGAFAGAGGRFR
jgi:hypothetical protein